MPNYMIRQMDEIEGVDCPCGISRRAFVSEDNPVATLHMVDIQADSKVHFHTMYYQKAAVGEKCSLLWSRWKLPKR